MSLISTDEHHLRASVGYLELGMFQDATEELENITAECRHLPEVLVVRLGIYQGTQKWDLMQVVAAKLTRHQPGESQWAISLAYATRRAESLQAAQAVLLEAVKRSPREPIIYYNLACYECQLGHIESAKAHLKQAFKLQPACREMALHDPDLEPLW